LTTLAFSPQGSHSYDPIAALQLFLNDFIGSTGVANVNAIHVEALVTTGIAHPCTKPKAPVKSFAFINVGATHHGIPFVSGQTLATSGPMPPKRIITSSTSFVEIAFTVDAAAASMLAYTDIVLDFFVLFTRKTLKGTDGIFALLTQRSTHIGCGKALINVGATLDGVALISLLALAFVVDHNGVDTACGALERSHRVAAYLIGRTDCRIGQCALVYIRTCLHGVSLKSHLALALILDGNGIGPARFAQKRSHRVDTPFVSRTDNLVGCALVDVGTTLESISLIARHALAAIIDYNGIWSARRAQKGAHCIDASLNYRTDSLVGRNSNTALVDIGATLEGIALVAQ
jgi:hypothetical protein